MQISRCRLPVASAGFVCLVALNAAQVTAAVSDSATDSANSLNEIIVTATKRSESLQLVPLTVQVVSQEELNSQNLKDTSDLFRVVPSMTFRQGGVPGNNAFAIRGVQTLATAYGVEQSAGVAFDGVPLARVVGSVADLVDIRSVEVLMGPQGMLFGKNATAGLINILANSPELGKTQVDLRATYGSLDLRQYSSTVNLAVTDDSALRISAWKFSHSGAIHEVNTGQYMGDKNTEGGRFKYRWQPTENLDLNFTAELTDHNANGAGYSIRGFEPQFFTAANNGAGIQAWELSHGTVPSPTNLTARGIVEPYFDKGRTDAYTGQADYSIGTGMLTAIVSYRGIKGDASFDPYPSNNPYSSQFKNSDNVGYTQLSEEIHYASPLTDRVHYVVGLYNFRLNLRDSLGFGVGAALPPTFALVPIIDATFDEGLRNENYAAFGEATWDITSQWHLIAGVRHSTDKVDVSMSRYGNSTLALGGPFAAVAATTYNDISWRTGLQDQITPDTMTYFTASRGYKGPGLGYTLGTTAKSLALSNNGIVKPEIAHLYEVGIRSQWFDRRLTANASVYNEIFDNFQTSVNIPGSTAQSSFATSATTNAPQMRSSGLDLNVRWAFTPSFSLAATGAYVHARYTDFPDGACFPHQPPPNCVGGVQNLTGHSVGSTPKTQFNLTSRYEHALVAGWSGFFQANGSYRSHESFDTPGDPYLQQGGYTVVNMIAGVNSEAGRYGISAFGNNVLNKHYVNNIVTQGTGDVIVFNNVSYEDLRTYGVNLEARF